MWKTLRELPLTILHVVSDGLERTFARMFSPFSGSDDDEDVDEAGKNRKPGRRSLWLLPIVVIYWLFRWALGAITFPVRAWFLPRPLRACYLRGLPAFAMVLLVIGGLVIHRYYYDSFLLRYTSKTISLLSATGDSKSIFYAIRPVANTASPRRENVYLYGVSHAQANHLDVASATMEKIAPDNEVGFAPAHQYRASEMATELDGNPQEEVLEKLQWHLEKSGVHDEERSLVIWARLHQARGEWDKATKALEQAGEIRAIYLVLLADLKEKRQDSSGAKRALERARDGFLRLLEKKPDDKLSRLQCAIVLSRLKRIDEAEKVLVAGLQLHRDVEMQRALADFYLMQFDDTFEETPFAQRFSWLARAMTIDVNYPRIYSGLVKLFHSQRTEEEREQLKASFQQILVSGVNPAVAHFALGLLAALSPETQRNSVWHLAQAQSLQPPVAIAYSNLAQTLAKTDPPRLEEAELFARQAVAGAMQEDSFYVTLGQILNAQSKWSETIEVLSKAIEKYPESGPLYRSLAEAHEAMGESDKASTFREIADRLENGPENERYATSR